MYKFESYLTADKQVNNKAIIDMKTCFITYGTVCFV